jgi:hypothetical protein
MPRLNLSKATIMGEVVNVLVAFAVIVFLFRWITSSMSLRFIHHQKTDNNVQVVNQPGSDPLRRLSDSDQNTSLKTWYAAVHHPCLMHDPTCCLYQVDTIHTMFPDIPPWVYFVFALSSPEIDLLCNVSSEITSDTTCCEREASSRRRIKFWRRGSSQL